MHAAAARDAASPGRGGRGAAHSRLASSAPGGSGPRPLPACQLCSGDEPLRLWPLQADAIVVNTCGFVEDAKDESIEVGTQPGSPSG